MHLRTSLKYQQRDAAHRSWQAVPHHCHDSKSNHVALYDELQAMKAAQAGSHLLSFVRKFRW
jgi:hypothetical protein